MLQKLCKQVTAQDHIPARMRGETRDLVAYKYMKYTFGHSFNRYAWIVQPPGDLSEYYNDRQRVLGAALSKVATAVLQAAKDANFDGLVNGHVRHTFSRVLPETVLSEDLTYLPDIRESSCCPLAPQRILV